MAPLEPRSNTKPSAPGALACLGSGTEPVSSVERFMSALGAAAFGGIFCGVLVAQLIPGDPGGWLGVATSAVVGAYLLRAVRVS